MRVTGIGHALFAVTMIAIGLMSLMSGHFAPIWAAVPKATPARDILVAVTAVVSVASGLGLLWKSAAAISAFVLFIVLLLWMSLFKVSVIIGAPLTPVVYESWGETAVLVAAAWVLYASLASNGFAAGNEGIQSARLLYALALIAFGAAHFAYIKLTASLVPNWISSHEAWAYFTGASYVAAGIAILTGIAARLAATLAVVQIGLFTALVWVPFVITGHPDAGQLSEFVVSSALTAAAWVIADSYQSSPWLSARQP